MSEKLNIQDRSSKFPHEIPKEWKKKYADIKLIKTKNGQEYFYGIDKKNGKKVRLIKKELNKLDKNVYDNFGYSPAVRQDYNYNPKSWESKYGHIFQESLESRSLRNDVADLRSELSDLTRRLEDKGILPPKETTTEANENSDQSTQLRQSTLVGAGDLDISPVEGEEVVDDRVVIAQPPPPVTAEVETAETTDESLVAPAGLIRRRDMDPERGWRERVTLWRARRIAYEDPVAQEIRYVDDERDPVPLVASLGAVALATVALIVALEKDNHGDEIKSLNNRVVHVEKNFNKHVQIDAVRDEDDIARDTADIIRDQQAAIERVDLGKRITALENEEKTENRFGESSQGDGRKNHGEIGERFNVEPSNGLTNEFQDYAKAHNYEIPSGGQAWMIYLNMRDQFGTDLIDLIGKSPDTYIRTQGDVGISAPGSAEWPPEVEEFLRQRLSKIG